MDASATTSSVREASVGTAQPGLRPQSRLPAPRCEAWQAGGVSHEGSVAPTDGRPILPKDVHEYEGASTAFSASGSQTGRTLTFLHAPTGIEVSGGIPPGHYTRTEMLKLLSDLRGRLWSDLEQAVADA